MHYQLALSCTQGVRADKANASRRSCERSLTEGFKNAALTLPQDMLHGVQQWPSKNAVLHQADQPATHQRLQVVSSANSAPGLQMYVWIAGESVVVARGGRGGMGVTRPTREDSARQRTRKRRFLVSLLLTCPFVQSHTTSTVWQLWLQLTPLVWPPLCVPFSLYDWTGFPIYNPFVCTFVTGRLDRVSNTYCICVYLPLADWTGFPIHLCVPFSLDD